jgi:glucokinase
MYLNDKIMLKNESPTYILAADIGGSHITAGLYNTQLRMIEPETLLRTEVYSKGTAKYILNTWAGVFERLAENPDFPVTGVALAMPGPFDYESGISYIKGLNKYDALYGMNIKNYLADIVQLHPSKIKFRNDAEATIAGEIVGGAGQGFEHVMGLTLGTGFGSAIHKNQTTVDLNLGSNAFKTSIADDFLSSRWFVKQYYDLTGLSVTGVKDLAEIADESPLVREIFKQFAINMSDFLMQPVFEHQPELLIVCGNIAKASNLFLPSFKKRCNSIEVRIGQLGEHAALIGAASLFTCSDHVLTAKL